MKSFKDRANNLHVIEAEFAHILPADCVEITKAEFDSILALKNALTPNQQIFQSIVKLETTITPRRLREAVTTQAGKEWLATLDAQISALRAGLVAGQP